MGWRGRGVAGWRGRRSSSHLATLPPSQPIAGGKIATTSSRLHELLLASFLRAAVALPVRKQAEEDDAMHRAIVGLVGSLAVLVSLFMAGGAVAQEDTAVPDDLSATVDNPFFPLTQI